MIKIFQRLAGFKERYNQRNNQRIMNVLDETSNAIVEENKILSQNPRYKTDGGYFLARLTKQYKVYSRAAKRKGLPISKFEEILTD